ncbi:MAG: hypothetical protein A2817_02455 [Candidatus Yanofskybacteria bacterium RIFCSPHIGHO2_01_FULL_39_8b]|uniref:Endolytic murein transglycosylase n=1 Tax=Candidatus Yanofskybacteria bacterium RIFCSPHIGHO2_01_FULL_39_8b TaxID=1802659 RepID=A0A1F8E9D8_9BACT|nr:MAG: hypothetical protein A2817_02455 [Candidatus Yanofskybacteria bacterium RIFCSPHIGHO2_01_FULL_39_8b]
MIPFIIGRNKLTILIIAISIAVIFILTTLFCLYVPADRLDENSVEINIEEGDGLAIVAQKLNDAGLIRSRTLFIIYVKVSGWDNDLKAGRYVFSRSLSSSKIVSLIVEGRSESDDVIVAIPEGVNIWEIDKKLADLDYISEGEFASPYYSDEGYLFPDTYRLHNDQQLMTNDQRLVEELRIKMGENFQNKTGELFKNLSLEKQKEIIIVASILEKEAKTEEDMKLVAGIMYKRLDTGMLLQIDATVIYGACLKTYNLQPATYNLKNCDVTFQSPAKEIKIDGPHNTYIRKGLPLTPISNPGLKSIEAALNPTPSDYLYYLSTRDGSQLIYSKTPAEHAGNRKKYLGL